ncbi:MAG: TonB-dependent receptor [Bacteroidetes bacterium]|nr:TonB-dependent receptor [Bacteroidota bacterium]
MKLGLFLFLFTTVLFSVSWSQPGGGGERPKIGTLTGQVKEEVSQKAIPYAKIFLLNVRDSSVATGALADSLGKFSIEEIQAGPYIAKITSFGFAPLYVDSLFFTQRTPKIELGSLSMKTDANQLDVVDVVYEKQEVIAQIDRKVFTMEKQLTSQGGTALDALQNVPSITIDMDGNVSLRGSANVTILIDGRPSSITGGGRQGALASIPASSIESIEVITNPSAKYDPDGMSGIINIVLKKNKMKGFNGSVDLSIENGIHPDSLDTYPKFLGFNHNIAFNLAYRNKFFNVYGGYSSNWYEGYRNFNQTNETFYNDVYDMQEQVRRGTHLRQGQMLKFGSDFYINPKNTVGFSVNGNLGREERTGDMFYYSYDSISRYDVWERISDDPGEKYGMDASVFWNKKFDQPEHKLDFNGQYSTGQSTEEGFYTQNTYNPVDLTLLTANTLDQYVRTIDGNAITTLQLDYYRPMSKTYTKNDSTKITRLAKLEAGAKTTIRQISQDYYQETFQTADDSLNNTYNFTEQVHAAYAIYGQDFTKFKYQVGMRGEMVFITSEIDKDPTRYTNNYYSLYPSLHLVKPVTKTSEVTLSYSRRVNRPGLHALNPFSKYTDPLNLQVGNPKLLPEYINSVEFGFGSYGKKLTLTGSVYYRYMTNMIQRVRSIDSLGVSTVSWSNVDEAQFIGSELMAIYKPVKWWKITLSGNLSQTYINSTSGESDLNNSGFSWSANMSQVFTFNKGWSGQITGFYRSPMVLTQGRSKPMYSLDLAVKKTFLKDKMYVNAKVTDIFNTRQFGYELEQPGEFTSSGLWKHQSRRYMITIGYVFGNQDPDRRKRGREGTFTGDGGDMGM